MTARCLLISFLIGETVPLLLMLTYGYIDMLSIGPVFNWAEPLLWPLGILLIGTGGGDNAADDQALATSILLNGVLYAIIGLGVWFVFLRIVFLSKGSTLLDISVATRSATARRLLVPFLIGENVPLLILFTYRYVETPWIGAIFDGATRVLWPLSLLFAAIGAGEIFADDQARAASILLNGVLYAIIGLGVWFVFLRKGSTR